MYKVLTNSNDSTHQHHRNGRNNDLFSNDETIHRHQHIVCRKSCIEDVLYVMYYLDHPSGDAKQALGVCRLYALG